MTASRRKALFRLRENREKGGPEETRPSFLAPPGLDEIKTDPAPRTSRPTLTSLDSGPPATRAPGQARQASLRPMDLDKVAEAAIARTEETGGSRRDQCEAAFRALLEREPYLPVASAQKIIDEALMRQGRKRSPLSKQPAAATAWVLFSTVLALLASPVAFPFAFALGTAWLDPAQTASFLPLAASLTLGLPVTLLLFPGLAWFSLIRQQTLLSAVLAGLPLVHIGGAAASLALG